ncbi:hypothetical protein MAR_004263 [Mya arenaria]|uniref:Uncharacterized protein n=1 Tax=Mya arenaria TaxID=6604 RepID=A0ABY7EW19_MYAAR|nr:hypothetical protein MAR_004263 [Mya arenaria]
MQSAQSDKDNVRNKISLSDKVHNAHAHVHSVDKHNPIESLAPEKICSTVQNIEEAYQKSACKPIGYITTLTWIVQQTDINEMCTELNELLNCVAQSIFGWSELEKIEPCVLHMRTALRNKREYGVKSGTNTQMINSGVL